MSTSKALIKAHLRRMFLQSSERSFVMKRDNYTCNRCKRKQTTKKGQEVKVQVHHKKGIDWDMIIELIQKEILSNPEDLEVLCVDCHKGETYGSSR